MRPSVVLAVLLFAVPSLATPDLVVQTGSGTGLLALSPDGRLLAGANPNAAGVDVFDLRTRQHLRTLITEQQQRLAFSPDGRRLAVANQGTVYVFDLLDGTRVNPGMPNLHAVGGRVANITGLGFSADGGRLFQSEASSPGVVFTWKLGAPSGEWERLVATEGFQSMEVAPRGERALLVSAGSLAVVELEAAKVVRVASPLAGRQDWAFTAGGKLVLGASDDKLVFLDAATLRELKTLPAEEAPPEPVRTHDAGGQPIRPDPEEEAAGPRVARTQMGRHALAWTRHQLFRVDLATLALVSRRREEHDRFELADGLLELGRGGRTLQGETLSFTLYDAVSGEALRGFAGGAGAAPDVRFDAQGRLLWVSPAPANGPDAADGTSTRILDLGGASERLNRPVLFNALSPDGRWACLSRNPAPGEGPNSPRSELIPLDGGEPAPLDLAPLGAGLSPGRVNFSPDGRYLATRAEDAQRNGGLAFWDLQQRKPLFLVPAERSSDDPGPSRRGVVFSPDGSRVAVAVAKSGAFELRELPSGKLLGKGAGGIPRAFSDDGEVLLVSDEYDHQKGAVNGRTGEPRALDDGLAGDPLKLARSFELGPWSGWIRKNYYGAVHVARSPDRKIVAVADPEGLSLILYDAADGKERARLLPAGTTFANALRFSPDSRRLLTSVGGAQTVLWDVEKGERVVSFIAAEATQWANAGLAIVTPEGFFMGQRAATRSLALRSGLHAFPVEQFDAGLNRPDLVLARLGQAPASTLEFYRAAHERRLQKLGLTSEPQLPGYELPEVRVRREAVPPVVKAATLSFAIEVEERGAPIQGIQVVANGVPLFGPAGAPLAPAQDGAHTVTVELARGKNLLEVSAFDAAGRESVAELLAVTFEAPPRKPDLYALAVGVSSYEDKSYQLRYAAKDAQDLLAGLQKDEARSYGAVHVLAVQDAAATREGILAARKFLEGAATDDVVIAFFAGHGLLDARAGYFFATVDLVFDDPAKRGLSFDAMDELLRGLRARHRLLLIDTCAAGETDEDEVARRSGQVAPGVLVASRGIRKLKSQVPASTELLLTRELFASLRRGSGASIIGSSSGVEYAFESSALSNGVFTHALLTELGDRYPYAREHSVRQLEGQIAERVQKLTSGQQHPVARQLNEADDFLVWVTAPAQRKPKPKRK